MVFQRKGRRSKSELGSYREVKHHKYVDKKLKILISYDIFHKFDFYRENAIALGNAGILYNPRFL